MRSVWKLKNYVGLSHRLRDNKGILWYDRLSKTRYVYNGRSLLRQRIRRPFVWTNSSLFIRSRLHSNYVRRFWIKKLKKN